MVTIVPIVEGTGDLWAVNTLVGRILDEKLKIHEVRVDPPINAQGRDNLFEREAREKLLNVAAMPTSQGRAILIVLDNDSAPCSGIYAKSLAQLVKAHALACPVGIVVARRSYESWLIASINEIAGEECRFNLQRRIHLKDNPEELPDPKSWIESKMRPGCVYTPSLYQGRMTTYLNLHFASRCRSFRKLVATLEDLVNAATNRTRRGYVTPQP